MDCEGWSNKQVREHGMTKSETDPTLYLNVSYVVQLTFKHCFNLCAKQAS